MEDQTQMSDSASASSSTCITCLPREILVKILTGLPAKCAVRFRCSCKFFYSYIPKPRFGFRILVLLPSSARSVLSLNSVSYSEESHGRLEAADSGLQLLDVGDLIWADCLSSADAKMVLLSDKIMGGEAVLDLSTGRHICLPLDGWSYYNRILSFEAVGFDSVSERYKVFKLAEDMDDSWRVLKTRLWVLTVDVDESWRELEFSNTGNNYVVAVVHINGIMYFIPEITWPYHITDSEFEYYSLKIVAIDVATESFIRFISFPPGYHHRFPEEQEQEQVLWMKLKARLSLNFNGRLSFINFTNIPADQSKMEIWTWERSMEEEWEKQTVLIPLEESQVIGQATSMGFATNSMGDLVFLLQSKTMMSPLILVYSFGRDVWKIFEISGLSNYQLHISNMRSIVHVQDEIAYFLE